MSRLVLGTRGSELALKQAEQVKNRINVIHPNLDLEVRVIKTSGDKLKEASLASFGGKGLFVKEIEEALFQGEIDIAVHSLKDLPTELPDGLAIGAVLEREDPREAWISPLGMTMEMLPPDKQVGTSSPRRMAQLLRRRPDLEVVPLRGNIHTRLRKASDLGAVVVALAGLKRLDLEGRVTEVLKTKDFLPAASQGALGLETRVDDTRAEEIAGELHHKETGIAISAERAFLRKLEGGCQVPAGALGRIESNGSLVLEGMAAETSGEPFYREQVAGSPAEAENLGQRLAEELLRQGAGETLQEIRRREEEKNE